MKNKTNPFFEGVLGKMYGFNLIVDDLLVGSKSAKLISERTILISPAMNKLMKDSSQEELRFLLANLPVEETWIKTH